MKCKIKNKNRFRNKNKNCATNEQKLRHGLF